MQVAGCRVQGAGCRVEGDRIELHLGELGQLGLGELGVLELLGRRVGRRVPRERQAACEKGATFSASALTTATSSRNSNHTRRGREGCTIRASGPA